jgi:5-hydroxyisourate hydrolase-like protein (transthyretin family)
MNSLHRHAIALLGAFVSLLMAAPAAAQISVTEYMYKGNGGEFVEFTNVGSTPVDMTRWSFSDGDRSPGQEDLSSYGTVAPGESVILTESTADDFRAAWSLCSAVKVIGSNTHNLGRDDEINLYDSAGVLIDRLTYGDDTVGGPRAQFDSAYVNAAGLGNNIATDWTLSSSGDAEGSQVSADGDVGSPGRSTRATVVFSACQPAIGAMRITEYMYSGTNGEFIEFTNVGNAAVNMTGWSYDDGANTPGAVSLSAYGNVAAGESVILTETAVNAFRSDWNLCGGVKIIGSNTTNIGRTDTINLYDASGMQIDQLKYGDQTLGGPRTQNKSAWVNAAGLGTDIITDWTLSSVGDSEGSNASTGGDIGSPGKSTRATVGYNPCLNSTASPTVQADPLATSIYLDLPQGSPGFASGVIGDPTDPASIQGIGFVLTAAGGGDPSTLTVTATSSDASVVNVGGLVLTGSGAARQLLITPQGVGYTTITVTATDSSNNAGSYSITYAASAGVTAGAATTRFHTGASDGSATVAVDDQYMFVGDDEINVLQLYRREQSGMPVNGFDFSGLLNLTDPDNPEIDIESSARSGDRVFWSGSYSNSRNFHVRPNRHRVFATDLSGTGTDATLAYVGRYDWMLEDLVAWDQNNGHGLGANYLGFAASSAEGVDSKTSAGFNIEGLGMAPDNTTAYYGFRAPQLPTTVRNLALIVPVLNFNALVTGAAPGSLPQGSAQFGTPILLDLGGRGIRSIDRNAAGQYLITAGPAGDASGVAPSDFRLYAWTGRPNDAPVDLGLDLTALQVAGGSFESIADVPDHLGAGTNLEFVLDNGDSVWYGDGVAAKDLANLPLRKFTSLHATVDVHYPAGAVAATAGTPQTAVVNQSFSTPLTVQVTDIYGDPVSGVSVNFTAPAAGASATLSSTMAMTGSDGTASVTATANASVGDYAITASVAGIANSPSFALTNAPIPPAAIDAASGTPQSAIANQAFATPLTVRVTDATGNPVANVTVTFVTPTVGASANMSAMTVTTDGNGDASVSAIANAVIGSYTVTASVAGVGTVAEFALTNLDPDDVIFRDGFDVATP